MADAQLRRQSAKLHTWVQLPLRPPFLAGKNWQSSQRCLGLPSYSVQFFLLVCLILEGVLTKRFMGRW